MRFESMMMGFLAGMAVGWLVALALKVLRELWVDHRRADRWYSSRR
jgi:hypothetical protein